MTREQYALYLVTDTGLCPRENLCQVVEEAILGGVTMVQLREKEIGTGDFYREACALKEMTRRYDVPLIINDRLDIMLAADADGLHIGQSDLPADVARRLIGPGKLLGLSAGNVQQAQQAQQDGADYIGVGAVFPTGTKQDATWIGKDKLKEIAQSVEIPIVGIGGIQQANIGQIFGSGIDGVAVVSAIMGSKEPRKEAQELKAAAAYLK